MRVAPLLTFADKAACCEARLMLRVQIKPRLERRKMDQGPIAPRRRGLSEWRSTTSGVQHLAGAVLPTSPGQCGGRPAHPLNGREIFLRRRPGRCWPGEIGSYINPPLSRQAVGRCCGAGSNPPWP